MAKINNTTDRLYGNASGSLTILSGATTSSDFLNLQGFTLAGLLLPAMTGTTVTFTGSIDGTNFYAIKDSAGSSLSIANGGTAGIYKVNPADFVGINYLKVVSGSAEGADRAIKVIGADILND